MAKYKLTQKTDANGTTQDIQLDASSVDLSGYVPTSRTINSKALSSNITLAAADVKALPNFNLNISHQTAGNPRPVKFLTVNYNTKATYFKMSATSCHDNGTSYQFLEDIIIGCTTGGSVVCNVYKYCQQEVTYDSATRNYGDVFYVIDTTNKIVDFYILCGQYASSQFTPATKIGNTTIAYITQYTGTASYYSSGTKVWANGNSTTYAKLSDISGKQDTLVSGTNIKTINGSSVLGSGNLTVSADLSTCLKNNVNGTIVGSSSDTPLFLQSKSTGSFIGFKNTSGTTLGYLGVNSSKKPIFYDTADRELALKSDIPSIPSGAENVYATMILASVSTKMSIGEVCPDTNTTYMLVPYSSHYIEGYNLSGHIILQTSSPIFIRKTSSGASSMTIYGYGNSANASVSVINFAHFKCYKLYPLT